MKKKLKIVIKKWVVVSVFFKLGSPVSGQICLNVIHFVTNNLTYYSRIILNETNIYSVKIEMMGKLIKN